MDLLRDWLYRLVASIAQMHDRLWAYNTMLASPFTDKEMHLLVTGALGLLFFLAVLPFFRALTRLRRSGIMAWLFVFVSVLFVTFAIEVGQQVTHTGGLELEDIVYGIVGFLVASAAIALLYLVYCFFRWLFR